MPRPRAWSTLLGSYGSPRRVIRPESGFSKPQMIFMRVDLPAPLSPSSPSTSPLRRCRLTSRRATTGPKRLVTCSTWRTMSAASATGGPCADPADVGVGGHRDDDRDAQVEAQVVGVDALDDQPVVENAEQQRADQATHDGARPSREQRAADHRRRDSVEQNRVGAGGVRLHGGGANGLEHPDEARAEAAQDEVADDDEPDL